MSRSLTMGAVDKDLEILLSQATEFGNILFWRYSGRSGELKILGQPDHFFEELQLPVGERNDISAYCHCIFPEDQQRFQDIISGNFSDFRGDYTYRLYVAGEIKYHQCRYERVKEDLEDVICGTLADVTCKVRLQEKETLFEYIAQYSNIGIFSYAPLTGKGEISEKWRENFSVPSGLSFRESMDEFIRRIHPEDRERIRQTGLQLRSGEKTFMDEEFRINTGNTVKWMRYIAIVRKYSGGNDIQIVGLNQDITHIKKQEERNQKILEALPDFIFIFDEDFFICDLLKSNEIQLLHRLDELIGVEGRRVFSQDVSDLYLKSIRSCLQSGKLVEIEYYLDARDERHFFQARMVPFEDNKVLALIHDIGDRVKRTQELIDAKQKAETADKLKSAFLANMSHEIRTPLNAIVGFSDLLMTASDSGEKEEYMQIISINNELLLKLINDILDLSKIESGSMELKYEEFDMAEYFDEITSVMQQRINNPNVRLLSMNPYTCCMVELDKSRFAQILTNYVTNSIKYTSKGFIEMGYEAVEEGIRFYVRDTGIGISDDKKNKVFSRFEKLDEFAQGTGLGLSICKAIADVCGGGVGFESEYGQGSLFWAFLPCRMHATDHKYGNRNIQGNRKGDGNLKADAVTNGKPVERKTILVAEDIQSNYLLVSALLQKSYDLIHALNGKEAVEIMRTDPRIDLLLMDMKMPEMDGMTATIEIRKFNTRIPIVALTAHAFDADKQAAMEAGCSDYLVKPVCKERLVAILQKYC